MCDNKVSRAFNMKIGKSATVLAVVTMRLSVSVLGQTCPDSQESALCIQDQFTANGGPGQGLQCIANNLSVSEWVRQSNDN